jgi:hypothetical protein
VQGNVKEKFGARRNETRKPKDKFVKEEDWAYFTVQSNLGGMVAVEGKLYTLLYSF